MRVIVTRPEREAQRWVAWLQARGVDAASLPLIEIRPPLDALPLRRAWQRLDQFAAVMFVSANAVAAFFREQEAAAVPPWKAAGVTRAWATGPGTAGALADAGVPPSAIDAPPPDAPQFDSEALWRQVAGQVRPGHRVLLVRGAGAGGQPAGRDWLAAQLQQAGAEVEVVAAYVRGVPAWNPAQLAVARQAAQRNELWMFSSSEAVANLAGLLPGQDWSRARAVATHERIAQAARDAGFGVVYLSRPGLDDVARTLESIG